MRHMPRRHMLARRLHVGRGIIKENVGAERVEERAFVAAPEEQRFVDAHTPATQGEDDALVRGCGACGNESRADR